jgi:membrane fusion protein, macrolide-specific efflux system
MKLKSLIKPWWAKLMVIVAVLAAAWGVNRVVNPPPPPPGPPTAKVEKADIRQTVQAVGVLQAKTRVDVGAQVSGQIQTLHVQLGQAVKKGDLLVSLDPELARTEVTQAEANLAQQRAGLEARQIDLKNARREAERQRRLLAGDATAAQEAERAENDLAKLEAEVRGQSAVLQRLQADADRAKLRLSYTRITAPMDGVVVNLPVQVGQTVIAVQITPVMLTLADLDTITVRTKVPEVDIQSVKVAQKAGFLTLAGDSQRYEGQVRVIQPVPERSGNAVFYNVLFEVDNKARKLFSDMTVQVDIETGAVTGVLAMPMVALGERDKDGRFKVTVVDDKGKQAQRAVRTGLQDGAKVQIVDGLKAGETVLLAPPSEAASEAASAAK